MAPSGASGQDPLRFSMLGSLYRRWSASSRTSEMTAGTSMGLAMISSSSSAMGQACRPRVFTAYHGMTTGHAIMTNNPRSCTSAILRARASVRIQLAAATIGASAVPKLTSGFDGRGGSAYSAAMTAQTPPVTSNGRSDAVPKPGAASMCWAPGVWTRPQTVTGCRRTVARCWPGSWGSFIGASTAGGRTMTAKARLSDPVPTRSGSQGKHAPSALRRGGRLGEFLPEVLQAVFGPALHSFSTGDL